MTNALQTFLSLVIQYFAPRHNAQVRFLKAQIAILRKRLPREHIVPSPEEKAELLRLGREFGHDVAPVLDVVTLPTYRRWVNDARRGRKPKRSGRPRLSPDLRALVVRIGRENILWGYRRIVGELKKLGHTIASNSVKAILKEHNIHPTPEKIHRKQPPMPWGQFLQAHMETLVACDFFTKTVHTLRGKFDAYCLAFIHLKTRRVFCSPATFTPDEKWMMQQARNAAMWMQEEGIQPTMLIMDHDTKFTLQFRQFWRDLDVRPKQIPINAPQANAFAESFIANIKGECLNHFIIFSLSQMNYVVHSWTSFYNTLRPHRGKDIGNRVLDPNFTVRTKGVVRCRQRLGGLIKSYYRAAA
jgi:putative transposase